MSAYNSMNKRIKNALVLLATSIQYDVGQGLEPAFTQVLDNNRQVFDGWPNVSVLPGKLQVQRDTTHQADKIPSYILRIRIPMEDSNISQSAAYSYMYDLTDLLIDAFLMADNQQSLTDSQGLIAITMMDTSLGDWLEVPSSQGSVLICDVNIAITYSKNLY